MVPATHYVEPYETERLGKRTSGMRLESWTDRLKIRLRTDSERLKTLDLGQNEDLNGDQVPDSAFQETIAAQLKH